MKKIISALLTLICALLFSCQTMPEKQVSQMKNYFLESPSGGKIFFEKYGEAKDYYNAASSEIERELKELGYNRVQNAKDAQFVLSPRYFTESFDYPDPFAHKPDEVNLNTKQSLALNFTIRASSKEGKFLLSCDTNVKIIPETLNIANIKRQVEWSLRHFPKHDAKTAK